MNYFLLNSECYFVKGASRGAIYDLAANRIISVGPELSEILDSCEKVRPLNEVFEKTDDKKRATEVLEQLASNGLGKFYDRPTIIEKIKPRLTKYQIKTRNIIPKLNQLYLEINNRCTLNCSFCKLDSVSLIKRTGCYIWPETPGEKRKLLIEDWEQILKDGIDFAAKEILFIGGDPLLEWDVLKKLLKKAKYLKYPSIKVLTNGTNLTEDKIIFLKEYSVNIVLQFFSHEEYLYDEIVKTKNAFKTVVKSIHMLKLHSIDFSFIVTITDGSNGKDTITWLEQFSPKEIVTDHIFSESNLISPDFILRNVKDSNNKLITTNYKKDIFFQRCEGHSCWEGKLSVCNNGQVIPCPFARTEIIAEYSKNVLQEIFCNKAYEKYWDMTNEDIDRCKDCEYRYVCFDCRPIEKSLTGYFNGKSNLCRYDPLKGEWNLPVKNNFI